MIENSLPAGAAEAHQRTLKELKSSGNRLDGVGDSRGPSWEFLGYTTGLFDPRSRVSVAPAAPLNTLGAVARFVWLLAGSDRLEDIAYYEPRVGTFTDDGLSVPGSSYGRRLFNAAPGTNQINGVVRELKTHPGSRRAAAVVWLPEDAVRASNDIPCTFGLFFHIRDGGLVMTTVMRSNNAVTLLPYNFFEFSMLGEIVATEVGVPFDRYVHWAASMHVFESFAASVDAVIADPHLASVQMPPMPAGDALQKGLALARHEAKLRHAATLEEVLVVAAAARKELGDYWSDLFNVLLAYGLAKRGNREESLRELESLPDYLRGGATKAITKILGPLPAVHTGDDALFPVDEVDGSRRASTATQVATSTFAGGSGKTEWLLDVLRELSTTASPITVEEIFQLQADLTRDDVILAGRDSDAAAELTQADVEKSLRKIRTNGSGT